MGKLALAKITSINSQQHAAASLKYVKIAAVELKERGTSLQNAYDQAYQQDSVRTSSYLGTFLFTSITTGILVKSETGKNNSEVLKNSSEVLKNNSEVLKNDSEVLKNVSEVSKNQASEKMSVAQEYLAKLQADQLLADQVAASVGLASNTT